MGMGHAALYIEEYDDGTIAWKVSCTGPFDKDCAAHRAAILASNFLDEEIKKNKGTMIRQEELAPATEPLEAPVPKLWVPGTVRL